MLIPIFRRQYTNQGVVGNQHWSQTSTPPRRVLVVGRWLAVRLAADPRIHAALNLTYNALRQEAITEEIEVILLSADALRRDYPADAV